MKRMVAQVGIILLLAACSQSEQPSTSSTDQNMPPEVMTHPSEGQNETKQTEAGLSNKGAKVSAKIPQAVLNPPHALSKEKPSLTADEKHARSSATKQTEQARKTRSSEPRVRAVQAPGKGKEQPGESVPKPTTASASKIDKAQTQTTETADVKSNLPVSAKSPGDIQRGATLAKKKCKMCHYLTSAKKKVGPSLQGIYNRTPQISGVPYAVWNDKALNEWLTKPKAIKPKTKMSFPGLKNEKDRQDIIAYLKTL